MLSLWLLAPRGSSPRLAAGLSVQSSQTTAIAPGKRQASAAADAHCKRLGLTAQLAAAAAPSASMSLASSQARGLTRGSLTSAARLPYPSMLSTSGAPAPLPSAAPGHASPAPTCCCCCCCCSGKLKTKLLTNRDQALLQGRSLQMVGCCSLKRAARMPKGASSRLAAPCSRT